MDEVRTKDTQGRQVNEASEREARDLREELRTPLGVPTQIYAGAVKASIGQCVQVAPYDASCVVLLQPPQTYHRGRVVAVAHIADTTNFLTLRVGHPDGLINGQAEVILRRKQVAVLIATDKNNYVALKGNTALSWNYIDSILPTGISAPIECLYKLDETANYLKDRGAAGRDLVLGGNEPLLTANEALIGRVFHDDTVGHLLMTAPDAALAAAKGAMTFEIIMAAQYVTGDPDVLFGISGLAPDTEVNNAQLTVYISEVGLTNRIRLLHEHGVGVNEFFWTRVCTPVALNHLVITKNADGVTCNVYIDGQLIDTVVAANAATGGANSRIIVGGASAAATPDVVMFSIRLVFEEFTATQVIESYDRIRGQ